MIITFTPNPSVDRAFDVAALELGEINRASAVHTDAGGKGINVSRGLTTHSIDTTAVFPFGGADGELLANMLKVGGISTVPVEVPGETRTNITVVDERGATTKINAPGPQLSDDIRPIPVTPSWAQAAFLRVPHTTPTSESLRLPAKSEHTSFSTPPANR
jgi:1-phosphofructokinase